MTWTKVDDGFPDHPKVVALGRDRLAAMGLWLVGASYASRYLTDGRVPKAALPSGTAKLAKRLVDVGLWSAEPDGFRIHDWLDFNPSRADALARRARLHAVRSEAGRAGGQRSGEIRRSKAEARAAASAKQVASPIASDGDGAETKQTRSPVPSRPVRPSSIERKKGPSPRARAMFERLTGDAISNDTPDDQ